MQRPHADAHVINLVTVSDEVIMGPMQTLPQDVCSILASEFHDLGTISTSGAYYSNWVREAAWLGSSYQQMEAPEQQTAIYPPPPRWFRLYRPDADGSAGRPLPPLPPAPISGDYPLFGRMESTEAGVPPLAVKQLFDVGQDGTVDFKVELLRLNRELLFQYLELVDTLIERPSSYGREVEAISTILRNMHSLLNHLRCHQARASLEFIVQTETADRRAAIADLRAKRGQTEQILRDYANRLQAAVSEEAPGDMQPM